MSGINALFLFSKCVKLATYSHNSVTFMGFNTPNFAL
jgi:hypothetical protein